MLRRSIGFGLVLACVTGLAFACGDDSSSGNDGKDASTAHGAGTGAGGSTPGLPGVRPPRGDGGTATGGPDGGGISGEGEEGAPCQATVDCMSGLSCVDSGGFSLGVCARSCKMDTDCGLELCVSRSGLAADAHCENVQRSEFAYCGAVETAICGEPRTCLYTTAGVPLGVCVSICSVDGTPATGDEDGGAGVVACAQGQSCIDVELQDETAGNKGFCAERVARGTECGIDLGKICEDTEICAPKDPAAMTPEDFRCREDCTDDGTCSAGKCTDVQGEFAYCVE
jgi:hypothetical protein